MTTSKNESDAEAVQRLRARVVELEQEVKRLTPKMPKMGYAGFSHCGCWNSGTHGEDNHIEYKCPAHRNPTRSPPLNIQRLKG